MLKHNVIQIFSNSFSLFSSVPSLALLQLKSIHGLGDLASFSFLRCYISHNSYIIFGGSLCLRILAFIIFPLKGVFRVTSKELLSEIFSQDKSFSKSIICCFYLYISLILIEQFPSWIVIITYIISPTHLNCRTILIYLT